MITSLTRNNFAEYLVNSKRTKLIERNTKEKQEKDIKLDLIDIYIQILNKIIALTKKCKRASNSSSK